MKKVSMNIQGHVQGVGFRYTAKTLADQLGVTGNVRNEEDGSVTINAVGKNKAIDEFVLKIKNSPSPAGHVTYVDISDSPYLEDFEQFTITI
ncbi:acylphosphatase [Melissococcus plutonius]|uniref:acylphosphatase n=1 Tax=Melissococcus plutonius TaxID=33970 RepID=A0A2Z5Y1V2_9ENTE|nr:acylphosphatase [Melissococcus plutonius]BAL61979.1 acylphosphatase [Melissococcus plutonius DAT561]MCV2499407.1 acylphosphatase [Melissococcus plutonius]MCV2500639.1 acylphosphatase [Melissococcus plutonius]MCV2505083.1 acylphosphatase [Melissococcus plutonius]MCV2507990.1 acylphosphatase [Melissococcus plutonius]